MGLVHFSPAPTAAFVCVPVSKIKARLCMGSSYLLPKHRQPALTTTLAASLYGRGFTACWRKLVVSGELSGGNELSYMISWWFCADLKLFFFFLAA